MMPNSNPYIINGKDMILPSYCVYMDILGLQKETLTAFLNNRGQDLFDKINSVVSRAYLELKYQGSKLWQHKIFTDNVVLGYPISKGSDGEVEFGSLVSELIDYQLSMALEGFFVRGAFSVGELYVGKDIVYGPAILEAYDLESTIANNPRIIFSDLMMKIVKKHLKYYGDPKESPQNIEILLDTDGRYFINYLAGTLSDEYYPDKEMLKKHKENIENMLQRFQAELHIWYKYLWAAHYHNYFCKLINENDSFKKEFYINSVLMTQEPKRLV